MNFLISLLQNKGWIQKNDLPWIMAGFKELRKLIFLNENNLQLLDIH